MPRGDGSLRREHKVNLEHSEGKETAVVRLSCRDWIIRRLSSKHSSVADFHLRSSLDVLTPRIRVARCSRTIHFSLQVQSLTRYFVLVRQSGSGQIQMFPRVTAEYGAQHVRTEVPFNDDR